MVIAWGGILKGIFPFKVPPFYFMNGSYGVRFIAPGGESMQRKLIASIVLLPFLANLILPYDVNAQTAFRPAVGANTLNLLPVSPNFEPLTIQGLKLYADDPFKFDFLIKEGNTHYTDRQVKEETSRLISYFLASLTVPEKDLWVNLSPYENNRIIPQELSTTRMGEDMLNQDYILKQLAASLTYPDTEIGKKYWAALNGDKQSFQRVWIVPDKAVVYADNDKAYVGEAALKVMAEEDYLAQSQNSVPQGRPLRAKGESQKYGVPPARDVNSTAAFKRHILPLIEKEVNTGKNFAPLRQMYKSLILAAWFKKHLKDNIINRIYSDKNKVNGVDSADPQAREKIYNEYVKAFNQGVYNIVKSQRSVNKITRRQYFSGGLGLELGAQEPDTRALNKASQGTIAVDIEETVEFNPVDKTKTVNNVVHSKFRVEAGGKRVIYVCEEDLTQEHLNDFADFLGMPRGILTAKTVRRFLYWHEALHAIIDKIRAGGNKLEFLTREGEESLGDAVGKAAIFGYGNLTPELRRELEALRFAGIDIARELEKNPDSLEQLLKNVGVDAEVRVITLAEMQNLDKAAAQKKLERDIADLKARLGLAHGAAPDDFIRTIERGDIDIVLRDSRLWMARLAVADVDKILFAVYKKDQVKAWVSFSDWLDYYPDLAKLLSFFGYSCLESFKRDLLKINSEKINTFFRHMDPAVLASPAPAAAWPAARTIAELRARLGLDRTAAPAGHPDFAQEFARNLTNLFQIPGYDAVANQLRCEVAGRLREAMKSDKKLVLTLEQFKAMEQFFVNIVGFGDNANALRREIAYVMCDAMDRDKPLVISGMTLNTMVDISRHAVGHGPRDDGIQAGIYAAVYQAMENKKTLAPDNGRFGDMAEVLYNTTGNSPEARLVRSNLARAMGRARANDKTLSLNFNRFNIMVKALINISVDTDKDTDAVALIAIIIRVVASDDPKFILAKADMREIGFIAGVLSLEGVAPRAYAELEGLIAQSEQNSRNIKQWLAAKVAVLQKMSREDLSAHYGFLQEIRQVMKNDGILTLTERQASVIKGILRRMSDTDSWWVSLVSDGLKDLLEQSQLNAQGAAGEVRVSEPKNGLARPVEGVTTAPVPEEKFVRDVERFFQITGYNESANQSRLITVGSIWNAMTERKDLALIQPQLDAMVSILSKTKGKKEHARDARAAMFGAMQQAMRNDRALILTGTQKDMVQSVSDKDGGMDGMLLVATAEANAERIGEGLPLTIIDPAGLEPYGIFSEAARWIPFCKGDRSRVEEIFKSAIDRKISDDGRMNQPISLTFLAGENWQSSVHNAFSGADGDAIVKAVHDYIHAKDPNAIRELGLPVNHHDDNALETAYRDPETIESVKKGIIDSAINQFRKMGLAGNRLADKLQALRDDDSSTSPDNTPIVKSRINLISGISRSHAGGMGINIQWNNDNKSVQRALVHELIAGNIFGDPEKVHGLADFVAYAIVDGGKTEKSEATDILNNLTAQGLQLGEKALWEMTQTERDQLQAQRDYASREDSDVGGIDYSRRFKLEERGRGIKINPAALEHALDPRNFTGFTFTIISIERKDHKLYPMSF
jgi:hypothetical protein